MGIARRITVNLTSYTLMRADFRKIKNVNEKGTPEAHLKPKLFFI